MPATPQALIDSGIRRAVYINRFASELSNQFNPILDKLRKKIAFILMKEGDNVKDIKKLLAKVDAVFEEAYDGYLQTVTSDFERFAEIQRKYEHGLLVDIAPDFNFKNPRIASILSAPVIIESSLVATTVRKMLHKWERRERIVLTRIINFGFVSGKTITEIIKDLISDGGHLDRISRIGAKSLIRTSINAMSNNIRQQLYRDNDDIIIGYTIIATLDNRTSNICKGYDHVEVKFTDAKQPQPPFHINCRTTTVALLDARFRFDDSSSLRGSVGANGRTQTSAKTSYYDWLKAQGKLKGGRQFVFDNLGRVRGKLFLDGGLSVEDFKKFTLSKDGLFRPLPIDELEGKDSLSVAFERANLP